jgi:hypothetical protein
MLVGSMLVGSMLAGPRLAGSVRDLLDLPGLDARRADVDSLGRAVHEGPNTLDVRVPPALRPAVRVADVHAERRLLATHFAHGGHDDVHTSGGV